MVMLRLEIPCIIIILRPLYNGGLSWGPYPGIAEISFFMHCFSSAVSETSKQNLCSSHSPTANSHKRSVPAIALTMNITKPETSVPETVGTKLSLSL